MIPAHHSNLVTERPLFDHLEFFVARKRNCLATVVWLAKSKRKFTRGIFRSLQNLRESCKIRHEQRSGTRKDLTQHTHRGPLPSDHLSISESHSQFKILGEKSDWLALSHLSTLGCAGIRSSRKGPPRSLQWQVRTL